MKKTFITLLFLFSINTPSFSQSDEQYFIAIINNFTQTVKSKNEVLISKAWEEINADPQIVQYMNTYFPTVAADFRQTQTIIESNKALQKFKENYVVKQEAKQPPVWPMTPYPLTNGAQAMKYPNEEQPSNLDMHLRQLNAPPPDNQTVVHNLPNQDATSNQDYIRQRLNRMNPSR